jgi:hypothetical protein
MQRLGEASADLLPKVTAGLGHQCGDPAFHRGLPAAATSRLAEAEAGVM